MPSIKETLCIIDGSSLLYRSYYGVRPLHTSRGEPTHAIYGFCRTLKKITDEFNPTHLVIAWDSKGPTIRHEQYKAYKATREAAPNDLISQKEAVLSFLDLINVCQIAEPGYEADDIIYSIAKDRPLSSIIIITGDKDLHQLLDNEVVIFDPFKQLIITKDTFTKSRGFSPQHLLLYHALLGDSSDNIPGVKGVGKKSAEVLTQNYKTLDNLYAHINEITPPRVHNALKKYKDAAYLSQQLFTLQYRSCPITLRACTYDKQCWLDATPFFHAYEIKPFVPKRVSAQQTLFSEQQTQTASWTPHLVTTEKELTTLCENLKTASMIALDTETTGLRHYQDALVGISCAYDTDHGYYIPCGHTTDEPHLSYKVVFKHLRPLLENASLKKTLHHAKFDQLVFAQQGITLNGISFDTLIAADLLRRGNEKISLKSLSLRLFNEEMPTFADVTRQYKTFAQVPLEQAARYAGYDAVQTLKLYRYLQPKLAHNPELQSLHDNVELPLSSILCRMEQTGIRLNTNTLSDLCKTARIELKHIMQKIMACLAGGQQRIDGGGINLNSPQQLETVLFDQLGLPVIKKSSKTGKRSTDHEVLTELSKIHPVPGLIIQYREIFKLISTYLEPLPHEINPRTGRIHTFYSQTITATGRLSSSHPNLQNIPAGDSFGAQIRNAFIAPEGNLFLSADYSQIELRILAHFTQDKHLKKAFETGKDIHAQTAAQIFDIPQSKITNTQRQVGKKINFSIMYGLTPFGLSKDLSITPKQAKIYIDNYFEQYPGVKQWMNATIAQAKEVGYVTTLLGRRRYVPGLHERNRHLQEAEKRVAINAPIQGTAADIIKLAMLAIETNLTEQHFNAQLVLQIHDELVLQVPKHEIQSVSELVETCMDTVVDWDVPLEVSLRTGTTWGQASK